MKKFLILGVVFFICNFGKSQSITENTEIEQTIRTLFDGFHKQDSLILQSVLFESAQLQTIGRNSENSLVNINEQSITEFIKSIVSIPKDVTFKEEIHSYGIQSDGLLATVWTPYSFYINGNLSHCGTNNFQLLKTENGWKIFSIVDTRKREGCID